MTTKQRLQETMCKDFPKFNILGWEVISEKYNYELWIAFAFDGRTSLDSDEGLTVGEEFDVLVDLDEYKDNAELLDALVSEITYAYTHET